MLIQAQDYIEIKHQVPWVLYAYIAPKRTNMRISLTILYQSFLWSYLAHKRMFIGSKLDAHHWKYENSNGTQLKKKDKALGKIALLKDRRCKTYELLPHGLHLFFTIWNTPD